MRRLITILTAIVLACGLVAAGATGASAAEASVSIRKIANKTVAYGQKVSVRPQASVHGRVKVLSRSLTVKSGSTTIAKNVPQVRLRFGTYRVTTKVRFRMWERRGSTKKYGRTKVKTRTQTLTIIQRARPAAVPTPPLAPTPQQPSGPPTAQPIGWDCPATAPIKGNASSRIYHVPGGSFYSRTKPEVCFATEAAAIQAGYRRSKV